MACWADKYIGREYWPTLEGNCLGFAREAREAVFARPLPGMVSLARDLLAGKDVPLQWLDTPHDGCLVLMGTKANPGAHVGLWCSASKTVVHAYEEAGRVVSTDLRTVSRLFATVRFAEYAGG